MEKQNTAITPELLDASQVGALLSASRSYVYSLLDKGQIIKPIRLGGKCVRWRRRELVDWIEAGCPSRSKWESLKENQ